MSAVDIFRYTLQHSPHIPFEAGDIGLSLNPVSKEDEYTFLLCQWGVRMTRAAFAARHEMHIAEQLDGLHPITNRQHALAARALFIRISDAESAAEYGCYWMNLRQMLAQVPDALRPAMQEAHTNTVDADAAATLCLAAARGEATVVAMRAGLIAHNLAQEIEPAKVWKMCVEILKAW